MEDRKNNFERAGQEKLSTLTIYSLSIAYCFCPVLFNGFKTSGLRLKTDFHDSAIFMHHKVLYFPLEEKN